jgi:hypothetical protein
MKRTILALAIAGLSVTAFALPPAGAGGGATLNVNVTNDVVPVEVSNAAPVTVRDADGPAMAPFRSYFTRSLSGSATNVQNLVTTVPAGKRLVLQSISWSCQAATSTNTEIIYGAVRSSQYGPLFAFLEINPRHASVSSGWALQDGSQTLGVAFEPGEEFWFSVSKNNAGDASCDVGVVGYWVTL